MDLYQVPKEKGGSLGIRATERDRVAEARGSVAAVKKNTSPKALRLGGEKEGRGNRSNRGESEEATKGKTLNLHCCPEQKRFLGGRKVRPFMEWGGCVGSIHSEGEGALRCGNGKGEGRSSNKGKNQVPNHLEKKMMGIGCQGGKRDSTE